MDNSVTEQPNASASCIEVARFEKQTSDTWRATRNIWTQNQGRGKKYVALSWPTDTTCSKSSCPFRSAV